MPIRFQCPTCSVKLAIASRKAGSAISCPKCKGSVNVPQSGSSDSSDSVDLVLDGPMMEPDRSDQPERVVSNCPNCQARFLIESHLLGKMIRCGRCSHAFEATAAPTTNAQGGFPAVDEREERPVQERDEPPRHEDDGDERQKEDWHEPPEDGRWKQSTMIRWECTRCGEGLFAEDDQVGKRVECPKCKAIQDVPDDREVPDVRDDRDREPEPERWSSEQHRRPASNREGWPRPLTVGHYLLAVSLGTTCFGVMMVVMVLPAFILFPFVALLSVACLVLSIAALQQGHNTPSVIGALVVSALLIVASVVWPIVQKERARNRLENLPEFGDYSPQLQLHPLLA